MESKNSIERSNLETIVIGLCIYARNSISLPLCIPWNVGFVGVEMDPAPFQKKKFAGIASFRMINALRNGIIYSFMGIYLRENLQ